MDKNSMHARTRSRLQYTLGLYEKAMPKHLTWHEKLCIVKESGYDFLEISIDETDEKLARLEYCHDQLQEIIQAMESNDMYIRTMCLSGHRKYPLGSRDEATRNRGLEIMEKAIDFADLLGIRIIQLAGYDVYYEDSCEQTRTLFEHNLTLCVAMAARKGIVLGFETMETAFMNTMQKAMHHVNVIGSPYLGVYPDIGNLKNAAILYNHDVLDDIKLGKGHIFAAHLKETLPNIFREVPFGSGHTDFQASAQVLIELGVRLFTGEFWYTGSESWREDIIKANQFLRTHIEASLNTFNENV